MFSQFWTHMMLIGRHLRAAGVRCAELRSHMKAEEKARALHRFRTDPAVSALQHTLHWPLALIRLLNLMRHPVLCAPTDAHVYIMLDAVCFIRMLLQRLCC